ncbi:MAG: sigma-70 family RNA polymerase sigma factor, partial [Planctomycetota bacterium]|nr:sigma-70 family RNA polymerase sigma factor [Planctomycetota bacterium]
MKRRESLEDLVGAVLNKDTVAFTELVFRHQNLALGTALALVRDRHLAQDIVQESFLIAYQRLGALREPSMFSGWLRGIVRNRCLRVLRRQKSMISLQSIEVIDDQDPVLDMENQELVGATRRAIKDLPSNLQEVVYLYYLQDQSQAAVARYLNKSVSTVNNLLHSARQK